ncbi:A24 family peptidase [Ciceribacter ferrooxidans]|uniref:Peptidase n=1 Tax=Ciceribacter ferrooxidans TaxID=2509717 RepID=A0A4Q2SZG7_9HYPH|nr:prepilin peptidase [Ciceribacter ferrooxidans]RYC09768.1 peptidase [Ciceribacter ferrooxidans]
MIVGIVFLVFPLCLVLAALTDIFEMTIPNRIPAVLLGAFLLVAPFSGLGWSGFGMHMAAAALVFSGGFALFALNVMGGGDAKLLTAAAVWFGLTKSLLVFLIYVGYAGGVLTLLILLLRARANLVIAMGLPVPHSILSAKKIPYGIAIAIGGLASYAQSPLVTQALESLH